MNVSRFKKNVFDHETDSNWKMTLKVLEFLPMCHHYIVVPENHKIVDDRPNVTLLKFKAIISKYAKLFHIIIFNISAYCYFSG